MSLGSHYFIFGFFLWPFRISVFFLHYKEERGLVEKMVFEIFLKELNETKEGSEMWCFTPCLHVTLGSLLFLYYNLCQ